MQSIWKNTCEKYYILNRFKYMAISDTRQRYMPTVEDRKRGKPLAYREAVLLTNPSDKNFKGEVNIFVHLYLKHYSCIGMYLFDLV